VPVVCAVAILATSTLLAVADGADELPSPDTAAIQELLGGPRGHRESWRTPPELLILTSVLDYTSGDVSRGFTATADELPFEEVGRLATDLTSALRVLTAGSLTTFGAVRLEAVPTGRRITVLRRGQIVVARYKGVRATANTIGYGGRTAREDGEITAATIILDSDFDRLDDLRRLLRTHELGHALGYNHVESLASVMNPRIGAEVSDFDRAAARVAFLGPGPAD